MISIYKVQKNSNFSANQWLDETITLPNLAEYIHPPQQRQTLKVEHTAQLLREFDSVFDAVELTHLTPPQTPPESPQTENLNDLKLVTILILIDQLKSISEINLLMLIF